MIAAMYSFFCNPERYALTSCKLFSFTSLMKWICVSAQDLVELDLLFLLDIAWRDQDELWDRTFSKLLKSIPDDPLINNSGMNGLDLNLTDIGLFERHFLTYSSTIKCTMNDICITLDKIDYSKRKNTLKHRH